MASVLLQSPILGSRYEQVWKSLFLNATQLTACLAYSYALGHERFTLTQRVFLLYLQRCVHSIQILDYHIFAIQLSLLFLSPEYLIVHLHNTFHYGLALDGSPSNGKRGAEAMRVYHIRLLCAILTQRQCMEPHQVGSERGLHIREVKWMPY